MSTGDVCCEMDSGTVTSCKNWTPTRVQCMAISLESVFVLFETTVCIYSCVTGWTWQPSADLWSATIPLVCKVEGMLAPTAREGKACSRQQLETGRHARANSYRGGALDASRLWQGATPSFPAHFTISHGPWPWTRVAINEGTGNTGHSSSTYSAWLISISASLACLLHLTSPAKINSASSMTFSVSTKLPKSCSSLKISTSALLSTNWSCAIFVFCQFNTPLDTATVIVDTVWSC